MRLFSTEQKANLYPKIAYVFLQLSVSNACLSSVAYGNAEVERRGPFHQCVRYRCFGHKEGRVKDWSVAE